jgi:hypothetical protein
VHTCRASPLTPANPNGTCGAAHNAQIIHTPSVVVSHVRVFSSIRGPGSRRLCHGKGAPCNTI